MAYILKIKFENNLRRLTLQKNEIESESFTFAHLESRIRELFQLPGAALLAVTYTDDENDVVTMGSDQDLKDALVEQALNPLRILVTLSKTKSGDEADAGKAVELDNTDVVLKRLLRTLSSAPETVGETVKQAFQSYDRRFEGAKSPAQIPGLVENLLQTIAAQVTSAVRNGAAAASAAAAAAPGTSEVGSGSDPATPKRSQGPPFCSFDTPEVGSGSVPAIPKGSQGPPFCTFVGGASSTCDGAGSGHVVPLIVHHGVICDVCGVSPIVGNRWKSKEKFDYDLCHSCFEKHGSEKEYSKIEEPKFRPRHMHGRAHSIGHPFHPMGAPFPVNPFHPMGPHGHFHGGRPFAARGPFGPGQRHHCSPMMGPCSGGEKLYARFVCDVTVFDGTEVAPGTRLVKIWRLRNSGTAPWPVNTSLVFVGGDELGHVTTVPLEIPEQGLAPEEEMEASVDMVAPEKPGRYVSHWRLASPAGPKFGQRLSVIIQVVPKATLDGIAAELDADRVLGDSSQPPAESADEGEVVNQLSNLHIPPLGVVDDSSVQGDVGFDPSETMVNDFPELLLKEIPSAAALSGDVGGGLMCQVGNPAIEAARVPAFVPEIGDKTVLDVTPAAAEELGGGVGKKEVVSEPSSVGGEGDETVLAKLKANAELLEKLEVMQNQPITYPVVETEVKLLEENDLRKVVQDDLITYPVVDTGLIVEPIRGEDLSTTKALLAKLEAMGFTDSKLNAELLEKNGFDLRKTLDDLCAAEEWDPILEELEEMGFYDTVMNRRLMFKNNGSVKRVVKELVQMYRDIQGKREKVE